MNALNGFELQGTRLAITIAKPVPNNESRNAAVGRKSGGNDGGNRSGFSRKRSRM